MAILVFKVKAFALLFPALIICNYGTHGYESTILAQTGRAMARFIKEAKGLGRPCNQIPAGWVYPNMSYSRRDRVVVTRVGAAFGANIKGRYIVGIVTSDSVAEHVGRLPEETA